MPRRRISGRLEDDRGARERAALFAYLEGVEEAGANLVRLPVGAGLLSGEEEHTVTKRLPRQASGAAMSGIAGLDDILTATVNRPIRDAQAALHEFVDVDEIHPLRAR